MLLPSLLQFASSPFQHELERQSYGQAVTATSETMVQYVLPFDVVDPPQPQLGARKLDISYPTNEFVKQLKSWETFDHSTMAVVVAHVKSFVSLIVPR